MLGLADVIDRRNTKAQSVMGLGAHLEELRRCLIYAVLGLAPVFVLSLVFARELLDVTMAPVRAALHAAGEPDVMQLTSVFEGFYNSVKVAMLATVVVGAPWLLYQLWRFVSPGLYGHERRFIYILAPLSGVLSASALLFLYNVILPTMLGFLVTFNAGTFTRANPTVELPPGQVLPSVPVLEGDPKDPPVGSAWFNTAVMEHRLSLGPGTDGKTRIVGTPASTSGALLQQFRVGETLDTFIMFALGCVLGFQTPVVVLLLGWVGIVKRAVLTKFRRHIVVACCVVGAALTPSPDPASMLLLSVPMYLLFELGVVLLWALPAERVAGRKGRDGKDDAAGPADGP
jgi:Sec-independent protein secretion pathway component TatC